MQPYLAWYNGTSSITLSGDPANCPDVTFKTIQNPLAIGGMTVPGNDSLSRTSYDKNPFYFWFPSTSGVDIRVSLQSSSDDWYDETQHWSLSASRSGDGYDISGTWIGRYPSNNNFYYPSTECWQGGDIWPSVDTDVNDAESWSWDLTGHISPTAADVTITMPWTTRDGKQWLVTVKYTGTGGKNGGPKLVTTGDAPTTDAVAVKEADGSSSSASASASASGSSGSSGSSPTSTGSGSGSSSASATSSAGSSSGSGSGSGSGSSTNSGAGLSTPRVFGVATGLLLVAMTMVLA